MGNNIRQLLINYRDMQAEVNDAYQKINQDDSPMSFDRIEELESGIERVNKFVNSIYSYNLKRQFGYTILTNGIKRFRGSRLLI